MNPLDYKTSIIGILVIGLAIVGAYLGTIDETVMGALITTGLGFLASADSRKEK